jgi:hypothetical protein
MVANPLKVIFDNESRIKELKTEIKLLEEQNNKCMEKVLVSKKEKIGAYALIKKVTQRRKPIAEKVVELLGKDDALKIAKFEIKGLEQVLAKDMIDSVCFVEESVSMKVIHEE